MDIEAEIRDLKRRVNELEASFVFLTNQVKAVHTDLLEFQKDFQSFRQDVLEFQKTTSSRFDGMDQALKSLRHDLPDIIAGAVGDVLRR